MDDVMDRGRSFLLVVDVQERLAPAVMNSEAVQGRIAVLIRAATRLGIPVVVSEQYPKGLGATVPALAELVGNEAILPKNHFSCGSDGALRQRMQGLGRGQAIIVGMESHVCVLQTAFGLRRLGMVPFVVQDGVSSRRESDRDAGIARMRASGIQVVTTEMVVFEWLHEAGTAEFKELSALIK